MTEKRQLVLKKYRLSLNIVESGAKHYKATKSTQIK
jgi:hypothetical protein